MIAIAPLRTMPARRGARVSQWEPVVRRVLALGPDQRVVLSAASYEDAMRRGRAVAKVIRDRGIGVRFRAHDRSVSLWLDEDLHPRRRRKHLP